MDHLGTLAPAGALPHPLGRRLDAAVVKAVAVVWGGSALPIVVTTTGVIVLALDLGGTSVGLRLAVVASVLAASLVEATRLRDRNRLIESERVATERLVETEAWRRMLIERLPAAVYLDRYRRADGAFLESVYMSPQMEVLTGYPIDAFRVDAELWPMMVHPDDRARFRAFDIPGYLGGDAFEEEYRIVRPDGRIVWVREEAYVFEFDARHDPVPRVPGRHHGP